MYSVSEKWTLKSSMDSEFHFVFFKVIVKESQIDFTINGVTTPLDDTVNTVLSKPATCAKAVVRLYFSS